MKLPFSKVFCINLERRPDRLAQAKSEFEKHGFLDQVEFIKAVDGEKLDIPNVKTLDNGNSRPETGCILSHLKVIHSAQSKGLDNYLIFEDDVELLDNFGPLLSEFIKQVPQDWDFLYFGGNHQGGFAHISENVARIYKTYTTHAFAVNHTVFNEVEDALVRASTNEGGKTDVSISLLHKKFNSYVFRPHLAFQRSGYSDITQREENYDFLKK